MRNDALSEALLQAVNLIQAHLEGAVLSDAHLEGATLSQAHLEGANLSAAHLEGTHLSAEEVQLVRHWKKDFPEVLMPSDLRAAFLSPATVLAGATLGTKGYGFARVAGVRWGGVDLSLVKWAQQGKRYGRLRDVILGDEWQARPTKYNDKLMYHGEWHQKGETKDPEFRLGEFQVAVQANRQLATALRDQGLNEDADRFAYRAQLLQRQVLRRQGRLLAALGSWLLDLVAGYGYKPMRSFLTYVFVVLGFAAAYFALGGANGKPLSWNEAIVVSMTAFHGRGFFAAVFQPGDLQAAVAAVEAFVGLLIEIVFIATFTQRFFAR